MIKKPTKKSVLTPPVERELVDVPVYTDSEQTYLRNLGSKLVRAYTAREEARDEFDGMSYSSYWWANERGANTMLVAKKNKGETDFQSGTLRTKLLSLLSTYQGLNLGPDISAFTENNVPINNLGNALEDIIYKTEEMENDDENEMLRQYEMLKQGVVFVEDLWEERWTIDKKITKGFLGEKTGVSWTSKRIKDFGAPKRSIISAIAVFLGDMTQYLIEKQPCIFTVQNLNWTDAEQLYGDWDMWHFVSKKKRKFSGVISDAILFNAWRLQTDLANEVVEVIKYQDKPNNEFQIILNGVPMLPMGYPLTEISPDGEYTLSQQNLEPIRHDFAIGKSFIFKNKNLVATLDQMMKLAVLKTQKSFLPPRVNLSQRLVSRDMFMPGVITRGILPTEVPPIDAESRGVQPAEFNMIQEMITFIDRNTVSQTFSGAREAGGDVTATQILELQRQARIMMGLLTLAACLLEKKLALRRLSIILKNWFEPMNVQVDEARKELKRTYRIISREANIEGKGRGYRVIVPTEERLISEDIMSNEEKLSKEIGVPIQITAINTKELKTAKFIWMVSVNPKEKKSSEFSKMLFRAEIEDAVALGLQPNPDHVKERFCQVWEEDPSKMFGGVQTSATQLPSPPGGRQPLNPTVAMKPAIGRTISPEMSPPLPAQ